MKLPREQSRWHVSEQTYFITQEDLLQKIKVDFKEIRKMLNDISGRRRPSLLPWKRKHIPEDDGLDELLGTVSRIVENLGDLKWLEVEYNSRAVPDDG